MNTDTHIPGHTEPHREPIAVENGDLSFPSFTSNNVVPRHPAKKPTRQWAAWTHEEEESFFNALRLVGKDFDKITCRVQSKNNGNKKITRASDQVAYSALISVTSANVMPVVFHEHQVTSMSRGDTPAATLADLPSNINRNICLSPANVIWRSTNTAPDNSCCRYDVRDEDKWKICISSIWDGEETCDAFLFKKDHFLHEDGAGLSAILAKGSSKDLQRSIPECYNNMVECTGEEVLMDNSTQVEPNDEYQSDGPIGDNAAKDFNSLADVYWPDSLGPLDLDIQSSKYHCEDVFLSDSFSSLNRLIASNLDEYQKCSFSELNKREASSTGDPREIASFSDVKIGCEV